MPAVLDHTSRAASFRVDALGRLSAISNALHVFSKSPLTGPFASLQRTGPGTRIDSAGLVAYGPHNLLLQSEDFSSASWIKGALLSPVSGRPDRAGGNTAWKLIPDGTNTNLHRVFQLLTTNGTYYFEAKAAGYGFVYLVADTTSVLVNLSNGAQAGAVGAVAVQDLGNGWWGISGVTPVNGTNVQIWVFDSFAGSSYSGDGVSGIDVWHPQLNNGDKTAYVPTTTSPVYLPRLTHSTLGVPLGTLIEGQATNLLGKTDDLTDADWSKVNLNTITEGALYQGRKTWVISSVGGFAILTQNIGVATGRYCAVVALFAGTSSSARAGVYLDTTGWTGHTAEKISGPGTLSTTANFPCDVTGLSTTEPTVVRLVSGVGDGSETGGLYLYPDIADGSRAGFTNRVQVNNVEAGSVATSYIPNPTTGTMVRAGDGNWDLTGADFTAIWGAGSERTIVFEWWDTSNGLAHDILVLYNSTWQNSIALYRQSNNTVRMSVTRSGGGEFDSSGLAFNVGGRNKAAIGLKGSGGISMSLNGAPPIVNSGVPPAALSARIAGAGLFSNGLAMRDILTSIRAVPTALTGSALQALSAL